VGTELFFPDRQTGTETDMMKLIGLQLSNSQPSTTAWEAHRFRQEYTLHAEQEQPQTPSKQKLENLDLSSFKDIRNYKHHLMNVVDTSIRYNPGENIHEHSSEHKW
jgi:hypothetical protein